MVQGLSADLWFEMRSFVGYVLLTCWFRQITVTCRMLCCVGIYMLLQLPCKAERTPSDGLDLCVAYDHHLLRPCIGRAYNLGYYRDTVAQRCDGMTLCGSSTPRYLR